jgi:AcrR family transcriptional regulator
MGGGGGPEPVLSEAIAAKDERSGVRAAVARLALEGGLPKLTSARICARAGISRRAFKREFASATASFLDLSEAILGATAVRARRSAGASRSQRSTIELVTSAICQDIADNPALATLCYVEPILAARDGLMRTDRWISLASEELQPGLSRHGPSMSAPSAEAALAAAWTIVQIEVAAGRARTLPTLSPLISSVLATGFGRPTGDEGEIENNAYQSLIAQSH